MLKNCLMCGKPAHLVSEVKCGSSTGVKEKNKCFFPFAGLLLKLLISRPFGKRLSQQSQWEPFDS